MNEILFIILSLLVSLESSTSIARQSGYYINNPTSGFVFQSSISLLSRILVFVFMPLLGYLADTNNFISDSFYLLFLYSLSIFFLYITYFYRISIRNMYSILLLRMNKRGSFFKSSGENIVNYISFNQEIKLFKKFKKFKKFYYIFVISYIPYYMSWPIVIILLQEFNEYRATVLGVSSVFNGINTIIITLFVDPKLAQLGNYNRIIKSIYKDLLFLRLIASVLALFILMFILMFVK